MNHNLSNLANKSLQKIFKILNLDMLLLKSNDMLQYSKSSNNILKICNPIFNLCKISNQILKAFEIGNIPQIAFGIDSRRNLTTKLAPLGST